jgi:hypothetical protein
MHDVRHLQAKSGYKASNNYINMGKMYPLFRPTSGLFLFDLGHHFQYTHCKMIPITKRITRLLPKADDKAEEGI